MDKNKIKELTLDFSVLEDLGNLTSVKLCAGNHIVIEGYNQKALAEVKYEISRGNALKTGMLKEIWIPDGAGDQQ